MKAFPSRSHWKAEKSSVVDLTIDHEDRRQERKDFANRPKSRRLDDKVCFRDLRGTSDYYTFFLDCTDKHLSLNVKGPLANLQFKFKAIYEEESLTRMAIG